MRRAKAERGWLSRSFGRVSDVAVFAWWVASGMPEQEQQGTVASKRKQNVPTILARQRDRDTDRVADRHHDGSHRHDYRFVDKRAPSGSPKSPKSGTSRSPKHVARSPVSTGSPNVAASVSLHSINANGDMELEAELQAHVEWIKRYLEEVRIYDEMKAEQVRRREAELVWKEVEETENRRRKTKSYYDAVAAADVDASSGDKARKSQGISSGIRARGHKVKLSAAVHSDKGKRSEVGQGSGAANGSWLAKDGGDDDGRGVRSFPAKLGKVAAVVPVSSDGEHEQAKAKGLVVSSASRKKSMSKDEVASILSKIRHRRYLAVIEILDVGGIDVETRDEFGNTLLMLAAQTGSKRMCKILLRNGASLLAQNWRGQTALHFCYAFRYNELGDYLKSKGADDSVLNHYGLDCYGGLEPAMASDAGGRARSVTFAAETMQGISLFESSTGQLSKAASNASVEGAAVEPAAGGRLGGFETGTQEEEEAISQAQRELSLDKGRELPTVVTVTNEEGEGGASANDNCEEGMRSEEGKQKCLSIDEGDGAAREAEVKDMREEPAHDRPAAGVWLSLGGACASGGGKDASAEDGVAAIFSWPPTKGRHGVSGRPPMIMAPTPQPVETTRSNGDAGGEDTQARETVVISAHEFQRLKALATPCAGSVRVVGDKAVLLASEYARLSEAALMMQGHMTPSSTRVSSGRFAERARAAGRKPLCLRQPSSALDPIAGSPNASTSADASQDGQAQSPASSLSGRRFASADSDLLNISSDQSSPFSAVSKESPALSTSSSLQASLDGISSMPSPAGRVLASSDGLELSITLGEIEEGEEHGHQPGGASDSPNAGSSPEAGVCSVPSTQAEPLTSLYIPATELSGGDDSPAGSLDWFLERRGLENSPKKKEQPNPKSTSRLRQEEARCYAEDATDEPLTGNAQEDEAQNYFKTRRIGFQKEEAGDSTQEGTVSEAMSAAMSAADWIISPVRERKATGFLSVEEEEGAASTNAPLSPRAGREIPRKGGANGGRVESGQRWVSVKMRWSSPCNGNSPNGSEVSAHGDGGSAAGSTEMSALERTISSDADSSLDFESELAQLADEDQMLERLRNEIVAVVSNNLGDSSIDQQPNSLLEGFETPERSQQGHAGAALESSENVQPPAADETHASKTLGAGWLLGKVLQEAGNGDKIPADDTGWVAGTEVVAGTQESSSDVALLHHPADVARQEAMAKQPYRAGDDPSAGPQRTRIGQGSQSHYMQTPGSAPSPVHREDSLFVWSDEEAVSLAATNLPRLNHDCHEGMAIVGHGAMPAQICQVGSGGEEAREDRGHRPEAQKPEDDMSPILGPLLDWPRVAEKNQVEPSTNAATSAREQGQTDSRPLASGAPPPPP